MQRKCRDESLEVIYNRNFRKHFSSRCIISGLLMQSCRTIIYPGCFIKTLRMLIIRQDGLQQLLYRNLSSAYVALENYHYLLWCVKAFNAILYTTQIPPQIWLFEKWKFERWVCIAPYPGWTSFPAVVWHNYYRCGKSAWICSNLLWLCSLCIKPCTHSDMHKCCPSRSKRFDHFLQQCRHNAVLQCNVRRRTGRALFSRNFLFYFFCVKTKTNKLKIHVENINLRMKDRLEIGWQMLVLCGCTCSRQQYHHPPLWEHRILPEQVLHLECSDSLLQKNRETRDTI